MNSQALLAKIRQQFDGVPYPSVPVETSPKNDLNELFSHSLATPYYLYHRRMVDTTHAVILDAGCGSGYKSLMLAEANPGARIVGVDLSEKSVEFARLRLQYYGFENTEFHAIALEDLAQLGLQFDYIDCDEVLYLLPDPEQGMQAMQAALKPGGILRVNLHSAIQRQPYYRAQELFRDMGLMDNNPDEAEIEAVIEVFKALKPSSKLRAEIWNSRYENPDCSPEVLANFLLQGDKGFSVPQMFDLLDAAGLEFIRMVHWRGWEIPSLFQQPDDLPALWAMALAEAPEPMQLYMHDLLHPANRLIDLWAIKPDGTPPGDPVDTWTETQWRQAVVHLHPQLRHDLVRQTAIQNVQQGRPMEFSQFIAMPARGEVSVDGAIAATLLPLWDGPQSVATLVNRYLTLQPHNLVTLEPLGEDEALFQICSTLNRLDAFLYVLVEPGT